jgi:hypothetical protein
MTQNIPGDPLDTLLHQWAAERSASSDHLDNLQQRIVSTLGDEDFSSTAGCAGAAGANTAVVSRAMPEPEPTSDSRPVGTRRASVPGFLVGVTLTVLVAIAWFTQLTSQKQSVPQLAIDDQAAMPEYARMNDDQLRSRSVLLSEMKSLFGDRLTWLAETDTRIEFGLHDRQAANDSSTSADSTVPLAVRVVVERRASADSDWQLAWSVDVMSRSEELVELPPATGDGTSMTLWAYALPDGMVAVDSELSFSDHNDGKAALTSSKGGAFQAAFSHVQQDRLPSEELLIGSDGVEYRVFQTVAVLDKKVG